MEVRIGPCLCGEPEKVIKENGKQILVRCPLWKKLKGLDPQDGNPIDHWGCSIAWIPILLIEGAKETREAAAAIESFRNEMVRQQGGLAMLLAGAMEDAAKLPAPSGSGNSGKEQVLPCEKG